MEAGIFTVICLAFAFFWAGGTAQNFEAINNKLLQMDAYQKLSADSVTREQLEAVEKLLSEGMKTFWFPVLESFNPQSLELGNGSRNLSDECIAGTTKIMNSTDPATGFPLIVKMLDAMGKIGAGYLEGNIYASGAYDECLNIGPGYAEYCLGTVVLNISSIKSPVPLTWDFGMCVSRGCTPEDVALALQDVTLGQMNTDSTKLDCVSTRKPPFNAGSIIMILVCFLFVTLVMAASIFDFVLEERSVGIKGRMLSLTNGSTASSLTVTKKIAQHNKIVKLITAFSLYKVIPQILSMKQPPSAITSINGLRVISMFWVILGHTHLSVLLTGLDNIVHMKSVFTRFSFQAIGNGYFAVDSFFVLSGLLVAYLLMRQMKRKNGRFPFLTYYIHRYLRLTPTYAFVLFFIWLLSMHLSDGPTYQNTAGMDSELYQNCKKYWWTNLLYINNFYPWQMNNECIDWSWYLANDMQFYIFSPLIIIPLYFILPLGIAISAIVIVVSIGISGILAGVYDHQANQLARFAYNYSSNSLDTNYNNLLYITPWHRVAPYILGLVLGYVLYKLRLPITISKHYMFIKYILFSVLWFFDTLRSLLPVAWTYIYQLNSRMCSTSCFLDSRGVWG